VKTTLTLLCGVCLSMACRQAPAEPVAAQTPAPPAPTAATSQVAAAKPVPAVLPAVVARVNGETITKDDFEHAVKTLETRAGGPVPADKRNEVYRGVLDQLIGYKLLTQEAAARKLAISDAEVDTGIAQIRQQFPNEDAFKKAIADQGMTLDKVREQTRNDLLITKVLQAEIEPKVAVADKEISDFYDQNKERFAEGEAVHASHILVRVAEDADAAAKAKARTKAESILQRVKAGGGSDFEKIASETSEDPASAAKGGDLGFFSKGQMVPAFETAAFALQPGAISGVVESPFGFHIIKMIEKRPAQSVPLDNVKGQIKDFLLQKQRQERAQAFVDVLKTKGKVEILI
jgi:peptidyl-prolyl cis-trans isomerase C